MLSAKTNTASENLNRQQRNATRRSQNSGFLIRSRGRLGNEAAILVFCCTRNINTRLWSAVERPQSETDTPAPTAASETDTPAPTAAPDPISLEGAGDSVVDIEWPESVGIMHIVGNAGGNYFGVIPYDSTGGRMSSLVSTTDVYDGVVIFNTREGEKTLRLEIQASGNWNIDVLPLSGARVLEVPGVIEGVGDEIIVLTGSVPDLANIVGNAGGNYFGVIPYDSTGDRMSSLVNTYGSYDGTAIMDSGAAIIEVLSSEAWTIEITGR